MQLFNTNTLLQRQINIVEYKNIHREHTYIDKRMNMMNSLATNNRKMLLIFNTTVFIFFCREVYAQNRLCINTFTRLFQTSTHPIRFFALKTKNHKETQNNCHIPAWNPLAKIWFSIFTRLFVLHPDNYSICSIFTCNILRSTIDRVNTRKTKSKVVSASNEGQKDVDQTLGVRSEELVSVCCFRLSTIIGIRVSPDDKKSGSFQNTILLLLCIATQNRLH